MTLPNPVHDLGTEAPFLGSALWATVGQVWTTLVLPQTIHRSAELSTGWAPTSSPARRTLRRAAMRGIHTIHRTYYYCCFSLFKGSTKQKQGSRVCARPTDLSRANAPSPEYRVRSASRTVAVYVECSSELEPGIPGAPTRVWKGQS
jgi:hypothetical protein